MHECLKLEEVFRLICSFLYEKELYHLALTCQLFKDPALDELWREPALRDFLKLFPSDAWEQDPVAEFEPPLYTKRKLTPEDWIHPAPYSKRIQRLLVFEPLLKSTLLPSVVLSSGGAHLFPNLKQLDLSHAPIERSILCTKGLIHPGLKDLALCTEGDAEALHILSEVGSMCPLINSFGFTCYSISIDNTKAIAMRESFSKSVSSWDSLVSIDVPFLSVEAFRHLSRLPHLTTLYLGARYTRIDPIVIPDPTPFDGFRSLTILSIQCYPLVLITKILSSMQTRVLGLLAVSPSPDGAAADWEEYYKAVAPRTSKAGDLSLTAGQAFGSESGLVDTTALQPLLAVGNLVSLDLSGCSNLNLSDSFIEELAKASPRLLALDIGTREDVDTPPTLTLNSFQHVFKHCPKIKALALRVDTDTERVVEEGVGTNVRPIDDIFVLGVGNSIAKNPWKIAAFLLPFSSKPLGTLTVCEGAEWRIIDGWVEVKNTLAILVGDREGIEKALGTADVRCERRREEIK